MAIAPSPDIIDRYRADIYLSEDSRPQKKIMSKYLCEDCEILETSPNYLMDFVEDNDNKE